MPPLYPQNCVNTASGKISSGTHLQSLEHQIHSFFLIHALSAESFIKCSRCYDNYECSAWCYISSYSVAHLHSFNAMVITQAILEKQLKQRSVWKINSFCWSLRTTSIWRGNLRIKIPGGYLIILLNCLMGFLWRGWNHGGVDQFYLSFFYFVSFFSFFFNVAPN